MTVSQNKQILIDTMLAKGITNQFTQAAILAVVGKETNFNPAANEVSYKNTANDRIRTIFSKTKPLTDAELNALKANTVNFFNFVYNGVAGNGAADGYKFRGRGYNQITGRSNYAAASKHTGKDLVTNPDLLAQPATAALALIGYFTDGINALAKIGNLKLYKATNINNFTTLADALGAMYHINAGPGSTQAKIQADVTGGLAKAKAMVGSLYEFVKANPGKTAAVGTGGLFFLAATLFVVLKLRKKKNEKD
ncbi:MAG: hypothetical protein KF900_13970 [Bacteroidetes bacterium]|nr:hypothetical protein [Bacteroidota bacterium]